MVQAVAAAPSRVPNPFTVVEVTGTQQHLGFAGDAITQTQCTDQCVAVAGAFAHGGGHLYKRRRPGLYGNGLAGRDAYLVHIGVGKGQIQLESALVGNEVLNRQRQLSKR